MSTMTARRHLRTPLWLAMAAGLIGLATGAVSVGPAGAAPSSTLVFSVDGGTTWSANVNAAPGQTVIAREYFNNDTDANISGAQVTTTLPSGFTLVSGTTKVCLNPGTTDPTQPTSEILCNTNSGGAAPDDEGGPINESSVWSGPDLAISPTAGLFGQSTSGTSGILAAGKVKYLNLDNCVWSNGTDDDYTNIITGTANANFQAGTNASDSTSAANCGPGAGSYGHNGSSVQNIALLGQANLNLDDCDYYNPTIVDNLSLFDQNQGSATDASNTAQSSVSCTESLGGFGHTPANSGVQSMDLLDNQYINLDECSYVGNGHDTFTTAVDDIPNINPDFDAGTNASNTPQTTVNCGPGGGGYPFQAVNSGVQSLNTLDTTRGQGFVQWSMTAPTPGVTTVYPEDGQLTGAGTGDPTTSGTITIDASVGTPLASPWVIGGGLGLVGLAATGVIIVRRRRVASES